MNPLRLLFITMLILGLLIGACNLPTAVNPPTTTQQPNDTIDQAPTASPTHTIPPAKTSVPTSTLTATPLAVSWNHIGLPTGAQKTTFILVHPEDENQWFVLGYPGDDPREGRIYTSADAGQTWQTVYAGGIIRTIILDPQNTDTLYSTDDGKLIRSANRGQNWETVYNFDDDIESMHISPIDGAIFVLPRWYNNTNPGVYRSDDGGQTWNHYPFGSNVPNFIPWDIEEDPNSGTLYVVIEIGDHPQPYDPPFYRSTDRGETWENIGDDLPHHGLSIKVDPLTSHVYFLSEGAGLYKSIDMGTHWARFNLDMRFTCELILDPASPARLFGGDYFHQPRFNGGVYYSNDGGKSFTFLGLEGYTTCDMTLNPSSTRLYVVAYEQGIYTAEIRGP